MLKKRCLSVILSIMMVAIGVNYNCYADEKHEHEQVGSDEKVKINEFIEDKLSYFYEIYDVAIEPAGENEEGEVFFVSADAMLKYKSVSEEPYFRGMMDVLHLKDYDYKPKSFNDVYEMLKNNAYIEGIDISEHFEAVAFVFWEEYRNLDSYINSHQDLNMYLLITKDGEVKTEGDDGFVSGDSFSIFTEDEQYEWGWNTIYSGCKRIVSEDMNISAVMNSSYNRAQAITYMVTYTSNPTSCDIHGTSCKVKRNSSYWNTSVYTTYYVHDDCANYVSQALKQGGFSTNSYWQPYTTCWIGVYSLISYFNSSGRTTSTTMTGCYTGDLAIQGSFDHIMMVTSKDGTTPKISGHTNDRKNVLFPTSILSAYSYWRVNY